ncbi:type II toxin-antitoxin system VapC family toxin [Candidatus Amesbacteria bacterium]|nr:type II toxin-antitoxin system VapC family toxin [Candidatus Amesbacteria bacterium]
MNFTSPIFLDTAPIIYFVEENSVFGETSKKILSALMHQQAALHSSHLTLSEVLIKPIKTQNSALITKYSSFFQDLPNFRFSFFDRSTAILTAQIRAKYDFRLADSANLALAVESGCKTFLTNDRNLKPFPDINITLLSELK